MAAQFINQNFVPIKIHIKENKEAFGRFGAQWTPTLILLDPEGKERYRFEGFLPPEDFLAQLEMGLARTASRSCDGDRAIAWLDGKSISLEPGSSLDSALAQVMSAISFSVLLTTGWAEMFGSPQTPSARASRMGQFETKTEVQHTGSRQITPHRRI